LTFAIPGGIWTLKNCVVSWKRLAKARSRFPSYPASTATIREAVQPLPADVAEVLREFLHGKPGGKPVWPGKWASRGFIMIRADLRAARQKKVHQELARHSTYALTGRHTHACLHDLAATVSAMSPLVPPERESLAATGTDGKPETGQNPLAHDGLFWDILRDNRRPMTVVCHKEKTPENTLF
jgi:hypothetical protein